MNLDPSLSSNPADCLAERFSLRMVRWYRKINQAPLASTEALITRAAQALSLANSQGHVFEDIGHYSVAELEALMASGLLGCPENPSILPLVLDGGGRLYLNRYFQLERDLSLALTRMARTDLGHFPSKAVEARLNEIFGQAGSGETDFQKVACAMALLNRLTVISGGPGTGKTTTVIKLLICLLADWPDLRITLAAPTGKAAARMLEALKGQAAVLARTGAGSKDLLEKLPKTAMTLHRLLGVRPGGGCRHHRDHPLALDLLVVDEASMLDLALAARLLDALPGNARLILLGDKDQLFAVESGSVFADLAQNRGLTPERIDVLSGLTQSPLDQTPLKSVPEGFPLANTVIWLTRNYRFHEAPGIAQLAAAINEDFSAESPLEPPALTCLKMNPSSSVVWIRDAGDRMTDTIFARLIEGFQGYLAALPKSVPDAEQLSRVFESFNQFRVLCAVHDSPRGVNAINRRLSETFSQIMGSPLVCESPTHWFPGRPVMVLQNDYGSRLFNGDIGIALPGEGEEGLKVYFPAEDGCTFRALPPGRLPAHDTAFAMTVHKSQGSEFQRIALILPSTPSRVITRELLYTGVTRARCEILLVAPESILAEGVRRRTLRRSGLSQRLREASLFEPLVV